MAVIRRFNSISSTDIDLAGGKGANLGELTSAGLPVPPGFVIGTEGYESFVQQTGIDTQIVEIAGAVGIDDHAAAETAAQQIAGLFADAELPGELTEAIAHAYGELADEAGQHEPAVAVRSSATAEDLEDASFAGQQDTFLNIAGLERLTAAVRDCWASLWTPRAIGYRQQHHIAPDAVSLAVVVQVLVDADAAGVLFTANPTTGRRDETVIAAAWGLGESVVGGTVTTDNLTLRHEHGEWVVHDRDIADKQVETVRTLSGTEEVAVAGSRRTAPVLSDAEAAGLADLGSRVAEHYDRPMDLEWARKDGVLWLLQARPITALPDPIGDPPTDWAVPDPKRLYYRASIVEMMPEPLTPLYGDLIGPAVVDSLGDLFEELLGELPEEMLIFPTINGYAYYGYGMRATGSLALRAAPLLAKIFRAEGGAEDRWREHYHPRYQEAVRTWSAKIPADLTAAELITGVRDLLLAGCTYYTGVQQVIPVAASSETVFTRMYQAIRRPGDPEPTSFVLGLESSPMRAERELYRLGRWCREHPDLLTALEDGRAIAVGAAPEPIQPDVWQEWHRRIGSYLDDFGHTISDLDFSNPVAADDPSAVLETVRFYARDEASDPAERQRRLAAERERATEELLGRLDPVRRRLVEPVLAKAQRYGGIREDALADVGLAWPTIRRLLAELGERLAAAGAIGTAGDVFWLQAAEVDAAAALLDRGERVVDDHGDLIAERKATWRGRRTVAPPQMLPKSGVNRLMERWMPAVEVDGSDGSALRGLGASGGKVTGRACVITDHEDFAKMEPGMIIVAKITTPAYTPLFAMAAGVVTDVGGPLSHSSIVAREYGIPAVLGTGVASQRIKHGDEITVDGTGGRVLLDGDHAAEVDHGEDQRTAVRTAWIAAGAGLLAALLVWRRRIRRRRS